MLRIEEEGRGQEGRGRDVEAHGTLTLSDNEKNWSPFIHREALYLSYSLRRAYGPPSHTSERTAAQRRARRGAGVGELGRCVESPANTKGGK